MSFCKCSDAPAGAGWTKWVTHFTPNDLPRLSDARPRQLKRAAQVDWPSLISVMHAAAERGDPPSLKLRRDASVGEENEVGGQQVRGQKIRSQRSLDENSENEDRRREENPFAAAVEVTRSLFSVQQVPLGVEHSLETGPRPCGFWVTDERARFVRRGVTEMLNSRERMGTEADGKKCDPGRCLGPRERIAGGAR